MYLNFNLNWDYSLSSNTLLVLPCPGILYLWRNESDSEYTIPLNNVHSPASLVNIITVT